MPNTRVQAELQMPSMMTRSLRIADARIFGLVLLDIAAVIPGDVQIGARRRGGETRAISRTANRMSVREVTR